MKYPTISVKSEWSFIKFYSVWLQLVLANIKTGSAFSILFIVAQQ